MQAKVARQTFYNSSLPAELKVVARPEPDLPRGEVVSQDPAAGSEVSPGQVVTLTVAGGEYAPATPTLRIANMRRQTIMVVGSDLSMQIESRRVQALDRGTACRAGVLTALDADGDKIATFDGACDLKGWVLTAGPGAHRIAKVVKRHALTDQAVMSQVYGQHPIMPLSVCSETHACAAMARSCRNEGVQQPTTQADSHTQS
jgi:hypothetical protein